MDIKNQIIAGFICATIVMVFIGVLGWDAVEKIVYRESIVVTGYKMKNMILECRRQEKNVLIRHNVDMYAALWREAFDELIRLNAITKEKGYISYKQS